MSAHVLDSEPTVRTGRQLSGEAYDTPPNHGGIATVRKSIKGSLSPRKMLSGFVRISEATVVLGQVQLQ